MVEGVVWVGVCGAGAQFCSSRRFNPVTTAAFGEGELLGRLGQRSRFGSFAPFGRRARSARMTERLGWVFGALGARGASRSRVRGSVERV